MSMKLHYYTILILILLNVSICPDPEPTPKPDPKPDPKLDPKPDPSPSNDTTNAYPIPKQTASPENFTDTFEVVFYQSNLTMDQREEYNEWISIKNSFSAQQGKLAKMTQFFAPEDPKYYKDVYATGWPFYAIAGVACASLIAYLVMRFAFHMCKGPKSFITRGYGIFAYILISKLLYINFSLWIYCCSYFILFVSFKQL